MELYLDGLYKAFTSFVSSLDEKNLVDEENPLYGLHHYLTRTTGVDYDHQMIHGIKKGLDKFQNDINRLIEKELAEPISSQNTEKDEDPGRWKDSVNEFNDMDLERVEEFFMQFAEKKCKNGEPFLAKDEVIKFIKRGFCYEDGINEISFNPLGSRTAIRSLFHTYFTICRNTIESDAQCQDKYVNLLTANFSGWDTDKVRNNFSKYSSYKWRINKPGQLGL